MLLLLKVMLQITIYFVFMFITFSFFFCPCVIFLVVPSSVQMFGTSISVSAGFDESPLSFFSTRNLRHRHLICQAVQRGSGREQVKQRNCVSFVSPLVPVVSLWRKTEKKELTWEKLWVFLRLQAALNSLYVIFRWSSAPWPTGLLQHSCCLLLCT